MLITLPKKFVEKNLDFYIYPIFLNFKNKPNDNYVFDLTSVEFIGNQELLVLSGLWKIFIRSGVEFEVLFFKKGIPTSQINERIKRQIIQFWQIWKIWEIVPEKNYLKYFGIDGNTVSRLQQELDYYPKLSELYNWYGITPFISLDFINNYNEKDVKEIISPIYALNAAIDNLLRSNNCHHPFTSNSLSTIITEELYLNFLDHSTRSSFAGKENLAFMSIAFQSMLDEEENSTEEIQEIKKLNFNSEYSDECKDFFYDKELRLYKNQPYINFSFLDFGEGIPNTLRDHLDGQILSTDAEILKYAFKHDSSRNPIWEDEKRNKMIPRGLFDALIIVKRYRGLLIVRSNKGKIVYDFSNANSIEEAEKSLKREDVYFPGTLITLLIPAIQDVSKLNTSTIKPEIEFKKVKTEHKKLLSINQIVDSLKPEKADLYSALISELHKEISFDSAPTLSIISFLATDNLESRIIKKCLYFLLTDYRINHNNNIIILNPPDKKIVDEVSEEIKEMGEAIKNYKVHPLPLITYDTKNDLIDMNWLGVYEETDRSKLMNLMFPEYTVGKSDLLSPSNVVGHLSEFDKDGNLMTNMPTREDLIRYSLKESASVEIRQLLAKHKCIIEDNGKSLFFCNGNYYQKQFIELTNLTNNKVSCNIATKLLFQRLSAEINSFDDYQFVSLASTGHKLIKSIENQGLINKNNYVLLDTYHNFEQDLGDDIILAKKKYILICDVISTGHLASKINRRLKELGTEISYIAVIVSALVEDFADTRSFLKEFKDKLIFLHEYPIPKFRRDKISKEILSKKIIRINAHTNIPITLSIKDTGFYQSVIFPSKIYFEDKTNEIFIKNRFLEKVDQDAIKVGYLKFNNVLHPYFFDTEKILPLINEKLLDEIFTFIGNINLTKGKTKVFYPRKSGVENFNFDLLKKSLKNHAIEEIEIERFGTPEGWRFPHNTNYLNAKIDNNVCLILDDGSCSGDSILQMVDEICFFDAQEIILLCIIGRVHDHKREFFSRLSNIKVKNGKSIPISIYFASHWHIPTYYLDDNPNSTEQNWLREIVRLQNTPKAIKAVAEVIKNAMDPKSLAQFEDYKYLPKVKQNKSIPKKEIMLIREEIGKVIGYRLYKESFKFFNLFMNKYIVQKRSKDRYKEIELLCATFLYEPYLYDKLKSTMPDVAERIQDFVNVLLFKNPLIFNELTYEWEKKDIVHLFFIVFKNEDLIKELSNEKFVALAKFTLPHESSLNYVLFKLLRYFPLLKDEVSQYSPQILRRLLEVSDNQDLTPQIRSKLKVYRWFVSSLPSGNSFQELVNKLKSNFERIIDLQYHDDNIYNDKQIINSVAVDIGNKERKKQPFNSEIQIIQNRWENIALFVNDILSFSKAFPDFFIDEKILADLEYKDSSLRKIFGEVNELIYGEQFDGNEIIKRVDDIFNRFILDESDPLKLFSEPITFNAVPKFLSFTNQVSETYPNTKIQIVTDEVLNLSFPPHFLNIVFRELFNNLRYSEPGDDIKIYITKLRNNNIKVKIWNSIRKDEMRKGGNNGEKTLSNLNNKNLDSYYKRYQPASGYLQIIKIKTL